MKTIKDSFSELEKAWNELLLVIGEALYIDKLLNWLNKKLKK